MIAEFLQKMAFHALKSLLLRCIMALVVALLVSYWFNISLHEEWHYFVNFMRWAGRTISDMAYTFWHRPQL